MDKQATKRMTMAQSIIEFLKNQYVEREGVELPFFAGCFGASAPAETNATPAFILFNIVLPTLCLLP